MLRRLFTGGVFVVLFCWTPGGAPYEVSIYENCTDGVVEYIEDGLCDGINNKDSCLYDGGDCCRCSCLDGLENECGVNGFDCLDEGCLDSSIVDQFPNCTGNLLNLGDGECDRDINTPDCGYDGGDCCMCTCIDDTACTSGFNCIDPDAGNELYACNEIPSDIISPCSDTVEQNWIVEDTAQAQTLAETTKCSGGFFQVEWRGNISIDETIYAVDGTVLHIHGTHAGAIMSGNLEKRLITVVNASLHLTNMRIEFGFAVIGGAIAASRSNLILNQTSFVSNKARVMGGAVYATDQSSVLFVGESTTFSNNSAYSSGGAIYMAGGSVVSWKGRNTSFTDNLSHHGNGGAVTIIGKSVASWSGETLFSNNTCGRHGGALHTSDRTSVAWDGAIYFFNNTARFYGGSIYISDGSNVSLKADIIFDQNFARTGGGPFVTLWSTVSWSQKTRFYNNRAGDSGGAMFVSSYSNAFGSGDTTYYAKNSALRSAGAIMVVDNSTVSWSGKTNFDSNTAEDGSGGAVVVDSRSHVFWNGKTTFINNSARLSGGAIHMDQDSTASWNSETTFTTNTAAYGGAVYIDDYCTVNFNGQTTFDANAAHTVQGGALSISNSNVYFREKTSFVRNTAIVFGGAVAFKAEISDSDRGSTFVLAGPTVFENNTCETSGGALGLVGGVFFQLKTTEIIFLGNRAAIAGGAIYMWGIDLGPHFVGVSFFSNIASHGGGVYSTASGNTLVGLDGEQRSNPVVFIGCSFVDNQAIATGGAIHSASGQDLVINTTFRGNTALEGGALNIAGTIRLLNCSFVENISDKGRGPAISNIGYVSGISSCSFLGNAFSCERSEFLVYILTDNLFEVLCNGCNEPCEGCYFNRPSMSPFCSKTMENSHSPGGLTTLNLVVIDRGYWRATSSGQEVLPCYNTDACLGGLTGAPNFCLEGYEGPYCAVCSDGYMVTMGFTCKRCPNSTGGIVVTIVFALVLFLAVMLAASYLLSTDLELETRSACIERLMRYIPMQSLKVVIVTWQIVIQFVSVANIKFPHEYQRFLDGVVLLDLDLGWMLSASCMVEIDFHGRLLFTTIGPIVVIMLLGITYIIAARRNRPSEETVQNVQQKHLSAVLLLTFFVYSNVSSILFQTFACEHLEDGKLYLRADYRIECNSRKHEKLQVYAAIMIIIYALGIPAFYATLLFKNRDILRNDETSRNNCSRVLPTSGLWRPYKPQVYYFETIECIRRALMVGVIVFFDPNTASQIAVTLMLAFTFVIVSESLDPYASRWNTWLSRTGHVVVFFTVYVALLLKVDVSLERRDSQRVFEVILVVINACMIAAVIIQALVMACSLESLVRRRRRYPS